NSDFTLGEELFQSLVSPGLSSDIENIVICPDEILNYLPFEALVFTKEGEKHWLIQDYRITYIPSITSLREILDQESRIKHKRTKDVLAFGDPYLGPNEEKGEIENILKNFSFASSLSLERLKFSGQEVDRIADIFGDRKVTLFKRKDASEENFKQLDLTDYRIIHFATHGLIDDKTPARSAIVLSLESTSKSIEDGFLQMREIFNIDLNSDLVTLSACQTALGQFIRGEGLVGLSRAFFYAGASTTLISLWPVNDQASAQLMERFYTHLHAKRSVSEAIQDTKLELIDSGVLSHPYYWAAFIVSGKSDTVISPSGWLKWWMGLIALLIGGGFVYSALRRKRIL
ncbi:CHAT domain-containing protein, partial [Acidobacteriota bacterium]